MNKFYAGIGSRQTPKFWLDWFTQLAERLRENSYILRSGGAAGADTAFEIGAGDDCEIYLPWSGFNNNLSTRTHISEDALVMAKHYHPNWNALTSAGRIFMARNCYQVLGHNLATPSDFIVCWTPSGLITGGTGQALRMAADLNIPVFNFGGDDYNAQHKQLAELVERSK